MTTALLQADGLACTVGHRTLFTGLSFALGPGEWAMLTGPNGSGKSTLLRLLAGLVAPVGGEVRWGGSPRRAGDPAWHACLLYQGHSAGFKEQFTASENLATQAELDLAGPRVERPADAVAAALERVGLARQRNLPFARLSAGQRRRLGLARLALASRPLWLLDEPTTALDADGQQLFAGLLDEFLGGGGCAVIATHLALPSLRAPLSLQLGRRAGAPADVAGAPADAAA